MALLQMLAIMIVGFYGANASLGMFKQYIPDSLKKYTPVAGVTAGIVSILKTKGWLNQLSYGATLFTLINLISQVIPETSPLKQYLPSMSGLGVTHTPINLGYLGSAPATYYLPPAVPDYQPTAFSGSYNEPKSYDDFAGI